MMETDIAVGSGLKVTCDRDELVAKLATVSRVVSTRGSVQVLSGVLLRPTDGGLELAATDMELSLRTTLTASVEGDSAVVVPGKLLVDLARLLPAAEVTIEYRPEDGVAHVSSGSYSSKLNVFSAEDFPRLPVGRPGAAHDRDRLAARDRRPRRAVGLEGRVTPGADRHPGALRRHPAVHGRDRLVPALVQADRARAVRARPRGDHPGPRPHRARPRSRPAPRRVALGVNENTVVFGTGDTWLTTRRIDGQFPDVAPPAARVVRDRGRPARAPSSATSSAAPA